ncbi:MAG: hypothetical protein ACLPVY_06540 [Acidimicrobiia bacterium]
MNREVRDIVRRLESQGWRIESGSKHYLAYPPDLTKAIVTIPSTPSGGRWKQNLIGQLRKSGADL